MKSNFRLGLCLALMLGCGGRLAAQITSVQFSQQATTANLQSQRGVPISTTNGVPPGSDGLEPTSDSSGLGNTPTTNQFVAFESFGSVTAATNQALLKNNPYLTGSNNFNGTVAQQMQLPVGSDSSGVLFVMRRASVGAPYISQAISYFFGSIIPPPNNDYTGALFTNASPTYWQPQPYYLGNYTNGSSTNAQFYYSPNAGVVFATQPGPISITWITSGHYNKSTPYTNMLATAGIPSFITNIDGTVSLLFTANYLISPSPVKTPQNMFWTEESFQKLGHWVSVPSGQISGINVIYNSQIPASVPTPYEVTDGVTNLFTLEYDSQHGVIRAFNAVGRVFVELLGQSSGNNTNQFLGFEIVDVAKAAIPAIVTNYLGNVLTPYSDPAQGANLTAAPINTLANQFYYLYGTTYYADKATVNQTDLQIFWLTTGVAGLQWPTLLDDHQLVWPYDSSQYSYYLRPATTNVVQAALTGVQLDALESPSLDYYDPLDQQRAFLSPADAFYTLLNNNYPAVRALLRFNANGQVRFERVFSYLAQGLQNNAVLNQSVATNLDAWNSTNSTLTNYAAGYQPPFVTNVTVNVGDQINPPAGAATDPRGGDYWAGYLNTNVGTSYDAAAYVNPFVAGFTAANQGAIIPVNAIPGNNQLEVWWFRPNDANPALGFQTVYWPSAIGDYTLQWPTNAAKIVLASNKGSGPLDSLRAEGAIYYQNDPTQPGYNPNEEHAVMLGGQAFALRDDLNVTNMNNGSLPFGGYSSAPFVLVSYIGSDGRPAISTFQVQREDPAAGIYFDYIVQAGTPLQAPMPLPLLEAPLLVLTNATVSHSGNTTTTNYTYSVTNFNGEPPVTSGDLPNGWTSSDAAGPYGLYQGFTFQDRNNQFWVYRGLHGGLSPLLAGDYVGATNVYSLNPTNFVSLPDATAVANSNFTYYIHVSRLLDALTVGAINLPPGLATQESTTDGLSITGVPTKTGAYQVVITLTDTSDYSSVTNTLNITVNHGGAVVEQGPLVISSTNQYSGLIDTYTNRPPSLAQAPNPSNSFTMRFYYKTEPGFAWPSLGNQANWPAAGAIVPYLLIPGSTNNPASSSTPSLDIVYRPIWPELQNGLPLPTMNVGQTLTTAINDLGAVRGQDSVQVLYQQSIATNASFESVSLGNLPAAAIDSVVLFDPTVTKQFNLSPSANQSANVLASLQANNGLPASVLTDRNNGFLYFPNLPPNLISRVWFDPVSTNLYFQGQFVADPVNGDYVMLNVLRGDDLAAVNGLSTSTDPAYSFWTNAVANLSRPEYTFHENPAVPGSYVIDTDPGVTVTNYAGDLVEVNSSDTAVDSYAMSATGPGQGYISYVVANGLNPHYAGDPVNVFIARVAQPLFPGALVLVNQANASPFSQLITFQHTADLAGRTSQYLFDWRIEPPVNGQPPPLGTESMWQPLFQLHPGPVFTLGATGIQGLTDNYISMRYGNLITNSGMVTTNWSAWANPILAPGWIKRVTQALDPVAGQTQNLYENPATTTASIIQLAGTRWNGAVPLNAASLTNSGLIQLYETVLDVGESLSINAGINYGPANQALLLASGYLNDLYMTLGNAAWANSLNPTIGFGTDNQTYGAVATASFCFEGEVATLLAQNLALLRGRDDSLSPGVDLPPAYNRLYWNYTYGISAGETIYALNYNITDQNGDGVVNAADAQIMFPQGHGDAYGHYLTAMMNYYKLLMNPNFDWVPQAETVLVLGAAVTVNYENETKFATAAAAVARTGRQIFDLEWRQDYQPGTASGWGYFATNFVGQYPYVDNNGNSQKVTRYWGLDHWAARVGQGTYLNWVVANSILPYQDNNPNDQGVQIVDRQTVQELSELPTTAAALQSDMDNANAGFTPLDLPQNAIPFDINPQQVTGANPQTHFEQIYARAVQALNNAVVAFNAAQNVTQELREQQNSLSDLQAAVQAQETAYNDQLIELYGTPYLDDIGPGATYVDGYTGPDLVHYMYVDYVATNTYGGLLPDPTTNLTFTADVLVEQDAFGGVTNLIFNAPNSGMSNSTEVTFSFNVGADGFSKPAGWTSERGSIGSIQTAIAAINAAQDKFRQACNNAQSDELSLQSAYNLYQSETGIYTAITSDQNQIDSDQQEINTINAIYNSLHTTIQNGTQLINDILSITKDAFPDVFIAGLADGGNQLAPLKAVLASPYIAVAAIGLGIDDVATTTDQGLVSAFQDNVIMNQQYIANSSVNLSQLNAEQSLLQQLNNIQNDLGVINQAEQSVNGAVANYQALLAQGNRIQQERLTFRQHTAAQVQGYTVADAAFLVFQNEDLERYTTLFNLAAQYTYMAANAYDYETGLLGTAAGQSLINQIIGSSALGVIQNGVPQISGSGTGDPGLANALAEMDADWQVLKGRLGFNNPDGYGTIASLRAENFRIPSDSSYDAKWQQLLQQNLVPDLRADSDVENNCLQIDDGSGQAVPGIELQFSTTITDGENLFGQQLGPGDHSYSSSSFATKIFSVGVCFDGYVGMDNPVANSGAGGSSPADPTLDPNALAATPYVYLVPCGADSMRSPPLGDTSTIRTWNVDDVAIPLPFNIGASDFSSAPFYTAADSLSEPLFAVRKQEAFRPVSTTAAFNTSIYGDTGALQPSQYTNQRLIGRSVWNSRWKLIIPGNTLLADPNQGLARFINSVKDVHLYFVTYSYSGN